MIPKKSKLHFPKRISILVLSIFMILFHSHISKHKKASKSKPDSEDLNHLRNQLKQLIKQQKIFNLIKKKGKNVKFAQQEAEEGTDEAQPDQIDAPIPEDPQETETPQQQPNQPIPETPEEVVVEIPEQTPPEEPVEETPKEEVPEVIEQPVPEEAPVETTPEVQIEEVAPEVPVEEAAPKTPVEEAAPETPVEADVPPVSEEPVETVEEEVPEETEIVETPSQIEEVSPEPPVEAPTQDVPESTPEPEEKPKTVSEDCEEDDTEEECLEKRLKSKLVHLLGVFDSLYSSMEEVCQASESVCKKILDRIKDFENLRPESSEKELEDILKNTVKETSDNVFEIAKQQLELKGEENISKLKSMIGDETERLIKGFQSQLGKFENEEQLKNQVGSQTTKVLKNLVESFYLNDYLKTSEGELSTEDSESSENEDDKSDPEDTLIKEITANAQITDSDKLTGLASSGKIQETKEKKRKIGKKKKGKKRNKHKDLDLNLDSLSDKTTLELLSSLLK